MSCTPLALLTPSLPIRSIGTVILSLSLNGVGIGGQQVAGVVDAMREAM